MCIAGNDRSRRIPISGKRTRLKKVAEFDLPGPPGKRFDYITIDPGDHYLIAAHLAAKQTHVIDLATNKVVATIGDTPGAEGLEYVPDLHTFYTSNAYHNTIGVVDLKQTKVIKKLKTQAKPDGSTYAAPFHKLYVSDERAKRDFVLGYVHDRLSRLYISAVQRACRNVIWSRVRCRESTRPKHLCRHRSRDGRGGGPVSSGRCKGNHGMTLARAWY